MYFGRSLSFRTITRLNQPDIRRATSEDVAQILALESNFEENDRLSRDSLRRLLRVPSADCLVADSGRVTGAAILLYRKGVQTARLYSISVSVDAGGQGIGRALIAAAKQVACDRDCLRLRLEVRKSNARAISLYERTGFKVIGRKDHYYDDGEDALIMQLDLTCQKKDKS
ncbi:MAG: hypothetical protein CBB65_00820 [Hyphomonadaceae bacterium TMED5]|nr:GNAT family N-acetyltransferase [Ponticaulis sp.]OUY01690.1 MAG: hypothetical protein CBB65_00820 [Hyphomonadaceae bacterium TMED5]